MVEGSGAGCGLVVSLGSIELYNGQDWMILSSSYVFLLDWTKELHDEF